jgi:hypothetical protein
MGQRSSVLRFTRRVSASCSSLWLYLNAKQRGAARAVGLAGKDYKMVRRLLHSASA